MILILSLIDGFTAENADRMAADFRSVSAGAEYTAMGKSGGALIDDVFSIYWNPAGLGDLARIFDFSSVGDNSADRLQGKDTVTDDDLINFSAGRGKNVQTGASGAFIYDKSATGFLGGAFGAMGGVIGAAVMPVYIEDNGPASGSSGKSASAGYLSYGKAFGPASLGISLKAFYEKIGNYRFYGFGTDAGFQLEVIPFVKTAIVVQDLATAFKPYEDYGNIDNKYDFSTQAIKFSAAATGISGLVIAFTGIKVLNSGYEFNYGLRYDIMKMLSLSLGLNDYSAVCSGFTLDLSSGKLSYALSYNWEDTDYTSIISLIYEM